MYDYLAPRVAIRTLSEVERILVHDNKVRGVAMAKGGEEKCRFLIAAPGREGSSWFSGCLLYTSRCV